MGLLDEYKAKKIAGESKENSLLKQYREQKRVESIDTDGVDRNYINSFLQDSTSFFNKGVTDGSEYSAWNDLRNRADVVDAWFYKNKGSMSEPEYLRMATTLGRIANKYAKANDYWAQFGSEDAYKSHIAQQAQRDRLSKINVSATEKAKDDYDRLLAEYSDMTHGLSDDQKNQLGYSSKLRGDVIDLLSKYGYQSYEALMDDWNQLDAAKHFQVTQADDYEKYSKQGASIANPSYEDAQGWLQLGTWRPFGEDIGNIVTFSRDNQEAIDRVMTQNDGNDGDAVLGDYLYRFMTDGEVGIYNYYLAKEGKEKADAYLNYLKDDLKRRHESGILQRSAEFADDHPILGSALSVLTSLGSGVEYAGDLANKALGRDKQLDTNLSADITNTIRGTVSEKASFEIAGWDAGAFLYNTVMSGADSLASAAFGNAGGAVLGLSAAAQGTNDALSRGMSDEQAFWNGLFAGVFEGVFESFSIGNFKALKEVSPGSIKDIAKNIGKSMLVNASEETLTEISNIAYDTIINGDYANYTLDELKNLGTWAQIGGQIAESALSGGLMGFGMGGAGSAMGYLSNRRGTAKLANELYGGSRDDMQALIGDLLKVDPNNALAKKLQKKLEGGKSLSGREMALAADQISTIIEKQEKTESERFEREESEFGDLSPALEALLADREANSLTGEERTAEGKTEALERELTIEEEVRLDEEADIYRDLGRAGKDFMTAREAMEKEGKAKIPGAEAFRIYLEAKNEATVDRVRVTVTESGEDSSVVKVASTAGGNVTVELEGGKRVALPELTFENPDTAVLYTGAATMNAASANSMIEGFDGVSNALNYVRGWQEAYNSARYGIDLSESRFASTLSEEQLEAARKAGRADRSRERATVGENRTEKRKGTLHREVDTSTLSEAQAATVEALERIVQALGIDIYLYYEADSTHNGWYDRSDGSIHLNVAADLRAEGMLLFTAAHELTHYIRDYAPDKFGTLADFLMEQYGQHGVSVSELVERQMEIAEADGRKVDYDTAFEEVIASSMETMLSSGNVVEAVAKLKAKDPTLWERFAEYFRNLAERIRKAFRGLSPTSREGRYVVAMKDAAERLEALFTDALVTASGREQSKNTAEGGVKYSYRNADQKVIDFVDSVRSMKDKSRISKRKLRIGAISKSHAHMISNIIKQATGNDIDLSGYEIWIDGNAIQHIDNRHGVNGDADQTMSDVRDIGMIPWVVNHADGGDIARDVDGSLDYSEVFYNSDGTAAPIVLLHKYIDNHLFVVAECVPDSRSKRLQIVSAYKKSSSEGQVLNMESEDSPQPTSEVPHDGNATTAISIPHESDSVKRKFSTNAAVGDDLYTQLQEMRIRERDAAERLDRAIQEMQKDPEYLEAAEVLMDAKGLSARREARRRVQAIEERYQIAALREEKSAAAERVKQLSEQIKTTEKVAAERKEAEEIQKSGLSEEEYHRKKAVKEFGYTSDFNEAGYLLPNGKMLNFSGDKGIHSGHRDQDHRAIGIVYANAVGSEALNRFMREGNIRIMAETPGFEVMSVREPTADQYQKLRMFVREVSVRGYFQVDLSDAEGRSVGTLSYEGRVNADRVINDLQTFYRTGEIRKQSEIDRFRYSTDSTDVPTLQADNAALREDNARLVQLLNLQRTSAGGTRFTEESVQAAAQRLMNWARATGNRGELVERLHSFYEYIARGQNVDWDTIREKSAPIVDWLSAHRKSATEKDPEVQELKRYLRPLKVRLSDAQMRQVEALYGSYNEYRKQLFGTVNLSKDASLTLDEVWSEMAGQFPGIFDASEVDTDMPGILLDVVRSIRENRLAGEMELALDAMIEQGLYQQVYESYWDAATMRSLGEITDRKIADLKREHQKQMDNLRRRRDEQIERIRKETELEKEHYRKRAELKEAKAKEKYRKSLEEYRDARERTELRRKSYKVYRELLTLLKDPTKTKHILPELQKAVAEALQVVDMDSVNAAERIERLQIKLKDAKTDTERTKIEGTIARLEAQSEKVADRLGVLEEAYKAVLESPEYEDDYGAEEILRRIEALKEDVKDTTFVHLNRHQLQKLYELFVVTRQQVRNANRLFDEKRNTSVVVEANKIQGEIIANGKDKNPPTDRFSIFRRTEWNNLKPVYAVEKIGARGISQLFDGLLRGESKYGIDMKECRSYFERVVRDCGYWSWDHNELSHYESSDGKPFALNLQQKMSLYAYERRGDVALRHVEGGGLVFDKAQKFTKTVDGKKVDYYVRYGEQFPLTRLQVHQITETLTAEQKQFVEAMQEYLSKDMGAKGNEVARVLYGIDLFGEKNYFPMKTKDGGKDQTSAPVDLVKLREMGMTRKTQAQASNALLITDFTDVWARHCHEMSLYHSMVLPLENFTRVWSYSAGGRSVKSEVEAVYGKEAVAYFEDLLKQLNGGVRTDSVASLYDQWLSRFKKAATFVSASVVVQQRSAIARAYGEILPQYFRKGWKGKESREKTWTELQKYAGCAAIKEIGGFDTGMGGGSAEWLVRREYTTKLDSFKGMFDFKDSSHRDEVLSRLPALMDELTWCDIWRAVKAETADRNPTLAVGSEAFLQTAGKRFTEVISKTQVYDSVLSRSANMRSKDRLMKMFTAFMAEPTTTINMFGRGIKMMADKNTRGRGARYCASVVAAAIYNSALVSIVYAMRDDDDDETYLEKYLASFTSETADALNPFTYLPFYKDIMSLLQGWDVARSDMTLFTRAKDALLSLNSAYEDGDVPKIADAWVNAAGALADFFGLPLRNAYRDVKAGFNFVSLLVNSPGTTLGAMGDQVEEGLRQLAPLSDLYWGKDTKSDKLYSAIMNGDEKYLQRMSAGYESDSALQSAIRKGLRENDDRIGQAAKAYLDGDMEEYNFLIEQIVGEGKFGEEIVRGAISAEINKAQEDAKGDDAHDMEDVNAAYEAGNNARAEEIIEELVAAKVKEYLLKAQAEAYEKGDSYDEDAIIEEADTKARASVRSSLTRYWKPLYVAAYKDSNVDECERIEDILTDSGLYGNGKAIRKALKSWRTED